MKAEGLVRKDEGGRMKDEVAAKGGGSASSFIPHPSSFSISFFARGRNAALGTLLIILGLIAAIVSVHARRTTEARQATVACIISLIVAALIIVLIVPPLARSARFEVARLDLPFEITTGGAISLIMVALVAFAAS